MKKTRIEIAKIDKGKLFIKQGDEYYLCDDVDILCAGFENSDGIILICGDTCRYITNTQIDVSYIINKLVECVDNIIKISDNEKFVIGANSAVFGKMTSMSNITTELNKIKKDLSEHKVI